MRTLVLHTLNAAPAGTMQQMTAQSWGVDRLRGPRFRASRPCTLADRTSPFGAVTVLGSAVTTAAARQVQQIKLQEDAAATSKLGSVGSSPRSLPAKVRVRVLAL